VIQVAVHHEEGPDQLADVPVAPVIGLPPRLYQHGLHLLKVIFIFIEPGGPRAGGCSGVKFRVMVSSESFAKRIVASNQISIPSRAMVSVPIGKTTPTLPSRGAACTMV